MQVTCGEAHSLNSFALSLSEAAQITTEEPENPTDSANACRKINFHDYVIFTLIK